MLYKTMANPFTSLWDDMLAQRRGIDRFFDQIVSGQDREQPLATWTPAVEAYETPDEVRLIAELPGINPEDVNLAVDNGVLMITGERRRISPDGEEQTYHLNERLYGRFERRFTLPSSVDLENIQAKHNDGLLTVILPKVEAAKPRRIEIKVDASKQAQLKA
jgi:HSP20 family protein